MDTQTSLVAIGDLDPHSWVRLEGGEVGIIHDKVSQPGYQKVCVEVPGARHPIRILAFDIRVEHVIDRCPGTRQSAQ